MHRIRLIVAALATAVAAVLVAAPAAAAAPAPAAAAAQPVIMNSIVLDTTADPHVYISGEGFGASPPPSYWAGSTRCGFAGWANGGWFGDRLSFRVVDRFVAGRGTTAADGTCVGLFVDHWSHDYVIHLGSAYGTRPGAQVRHGDAYVVTVRGAVGRGTTVLL